MELDFLAKGDLLQENTAYIVVGPTASGKSKFAYWLANKLSGAIVNADSMQVYDCLKTLTASPTLEQCNNIPHYMYNFLNPIMHYSVAAYLSDLEKVLKTLRNKQLSPIIVGGTGMYINSALNGISQIPEISSKNKEKAFYLLEKYGAEELYNMLLKIDDKPFPNSPNDRQRILRAYEVYLESGKPISYFKKFRTKSLLKEYNVKILYIKPDRSRLYQLIENRFWKFIEGEVLEEVEDFRKKYPDVKTSISKALGLKELECYLNNQLTLEEAVATATKKTRNFAKRQYTWFNNQLPKNIEIITPPNCNDNS